MGIVFRCRNCKKRMRNSDKVVDGVLKVKCVHCGCEGDFREKKKMRRFK